MSPLKDLRSLALLVLATATCWVATGCSGAEFTAASEVRKSSASEAKPLESEAKPVASEVSEAPPGTALETTAAVADAAALQPKAMESAPPTPTGAMSGAGAVTTPFADAGPPVDTAELDGGAVAEPACPQLDCDAGYESPHARGDACAACVRVSCAVGTHCELLDCPFGMNEVASGCCECELPDCTAEQARELSQEKRQLRVEKNNSCWRHSDCTVARVPNACGDDCGSGVSLVYEGVYTQKLKAVAEQICPACRPSPRDCSALQAEPKCIQGRCSLSGGF